jgi:putative tryptophan/tyrosine transport system substrate-binding protein
MEEATMTRYGIGLLVTLALALLVAPLAAEAQQPRKVPQIGVLLSIPNPELFQERFREGLLELGYTERQNIRVDYHWAAAKQVDRLNDLAAELERLKVDLIVALYTPSAHAAKRATTSLLIAILPGDPLGADLVTSLARSDGNITGLSVVGADLVGKCLQLLREVLPAVIHVAALVHATDPFAKPFLENIQSTARSLGVQIHPLVVQGDEDLTGAFAAMVTARAGAVIIQPNLATQLAVDLAGRHHLASISLWRAFAHAGSLMSYGANEEG